MNNMIEINNEKLALATRNLDLNKKEIKTLQWVAKWESETVNNICSIIAKAREVR